jgi:radical SAM protein with 4Fe4S-binding SPASM domain
MVSKPHQFGMPFFIGIEPTTSCNLRCPQCPSGLRSFTRPTGMLTPNDFENIIAPLRKHIHNLTFYFQGEPYLNPDFLPMVALANKLGIYTSTSTNAHFISPEKAVETIHSKLDKIVISIDGTTQESYETYRIGGQLSKVLEGTKELIKQKKALGSRTPHIIWQFVVFKNNEHQIEEIKTLGKNLGVDQIQLKTAQIYDFENSQNIIPSINKYTRYKKNDQGVYAIKNKMLNQCWRMWQGCVITWDGKVVPCCFDKDAKYSLGSVKQNTFKEVWFSEPYKRFRGSILKGRSEIDICKNCSEGTKVWAD